MRRTLLFIALILAINTLSAQTNETIPTKAMLKELKTKIGLKAGYNWSYVTANQSGLASRGRTGYMFGVFLAARHRSVMGCRTELIYSRQGYSFDDGGKNTDIFNDYLYLPQLTTFSIGNFFQLQLGGQIGFLLNSKQSTAGKDSSVTGLMNRIDYGFAGGIELNPVSGLIIGGRYNLGLGKMIKSYEQRSNNPNPFPLPFNPANTNLKNGVIQIFVGYKF